MTIFVQKVEGAFSQGIDEGRTRLVSEGDPEYQLIIDCNTLLVDIDNEIVLVYNFIWDKYRLQFPKFESLVLIQSITHVLWRR
jgi:RNA processing factor Prp31